MTSIEKAIARLRAYRSAQGISKHRLARLAGLGKNTLEALDDPDWIPAARTLNAVEKLIPDDFDGAS